MLQLRAKFQTVMVSCPRYSFKYFPGNGKQRYGLVIFEYLLSSFLCEGTTSAFLHLRGNFPRSRHDLNINSSGLQKLASKSFTVQLLITSWPWVLFESRVLKIFRISSLVKWIVARNSWAFFVKVAEKDQCKNSLAKKVLKPHQTNI